MRARRAPVRDSGFGEPPLGRGVLGEHHEVVAALRLVGLTDEPRTFLPSELVKLDSSADEDCR